MSTGTTEPSAKTPAGVVEQQKPGQSPRQGVDKFRPEIQGLRALAVLLVVIYHVWLGKVSGGVDIFLLVSTFLMTLQFGRLFDTGRSFNLFKRYVHTFKRLLPSAVLVIAASITAMFTFLFPYRYDQLVAEGWASLFYFENWVLAENAVDYYAMDRGAASPFQHFWSLSIQGQVFILWPIIFGLAFLIGRKFAKAYKPFLFAAFGLIFIFSLQYSIIQTEVNQQYAYFDARTRLWEFALGSLIALVLPWIRLPKNVRVVMGWLGIIGIVSVGLVLDVGAMFPGAIALWPLLAAALVIIAGQTGSRFGVDRILGSPKWNFLGDSSYALYLWHWPILVYASAHLGVEQVDFVQGLCIIVASLLLAFATTLLLERPIRGAKAIDRSLPRSLLVVGICLAVAASALMAASWRVESDIANSQVTNTVNNPGARVLTGDAEGQPAANAPILPTGAAMTRQWSFPDESCSGKFDPSDDLVKEKCGQIAPYGDDAPLIVFLGNSHTEHWLPAFDQVRAEGQYNVVMLRLEGCPVIDPEKLPDNPCTDFNLAAIDYVKNLKPDFVVSTASTAENSSPEEFMYDGWVTVMQDFNSEGIRVIGMRDNPRYDFMFSDCAVPDEQRPECFPATDQVRSPQPPWQQMLDDGEISPMTSFIDTTDLLCPAGRCLPVIGNVRTYIDTNHLTSDYVRSMAPEVARRFNEILNASSWPSVPESRVAPEPAEQVPDPEPDPVLEYGEQEYPYSDQP